MPRVRQPELMDDPGLDPARHRQALRGLARLNALSRADAPLWREVRAITRGSRHISILDVAIGSGEVSLGVVERARRDDVDVRLSGVDRSETALGEARAAAARRGVPIDLVQRDVVRDGLGDLRADVIVCSLFLHHLDPAEVERVLAEMIRVAAVGVVVSDLRRSRGGYGVAALASRLMTRSPIVHADALLSVRAAYTPEEFRAMAIRAGWTQPAVRNVWPWRMLLSCRTQGESR